MKKCVKCKLTKEDFEFSIQTERNGNTRLCSWCKKCNSVNRSKRNKQERSENIEAVRARDRARYNKNKLKITNNNRLRRRLLKQKYVDYAGGCCIMCGYNKYLAALDFHHIDPSKKIFMITYKHTSWEMVKEEIEKCVLLCSNCHRAVHSGDLILQLDAV